MTIPLPQDGRVAVGIQQRLSESFAFTDRRDALFIGLFESLGGLCVAPTGQVPVVSSAKQTVQSATHGQNCHVAGMKRCKRSTSEACSRCEQYPPGLTICRRPRQQVFNRVQLQASVDELRD